MPQIGRLAQGDEKKIVAVAELYCEIWQEPPWNEDFWKVPEVSEKIRVCFERQSFGIFVAEENEVTAGFTWGYQVSCDELREIAGHGQLDFLFEPLNRIMYLADLATKSSFRRRGIGEKLTCALIEFAYDAGITHIVLRTHKKAVAARNLYQKAGFKELPVEDKEYPDRTYWLKIF